MKTLVVYYSRDGANEKLALELAGKLNYPAEKLVDLTSRRGILGFLFSGRDALTKKLTKLAPVKHDPAGFDLVILVSPIWAGSITPAIRTYITAQKPKLKKVAFLSVSGMGVTNKNAAADLAATLGKQPIAELMLTKKEIAADNYKGKVAAALKKIQGGSHEQ